MNVAGASSILSPARQDLFHEQESVTASEEEREVCAQGRKSEVCSFPTPSSSSISNHGALSSWECEETKKERRRPVRVLFRVPLFPLSFRANCHCMRKLPVCVSKCSAA